MSALKKGGHNLAAELTSGTKNGYLHHSHLFKLPARMAHAKAPKAVVMRPQWATFQRRTDCCQSEGNALGDQRAKRRLSGSLTATVIPIVASLAS
jgi:hypothetical protein